MEKGPFIGIDAGSTTIKFVQWDGQKITRQKILPSSKRNDLLRTVLDLDPDQSNIMLTGYFKTILKNTANLTEITAARHGVKKLLPDAGLIIDIGGQDIKIIRQDNSHFILNDKCSAGTGAFLEMVAKYMDLNIEDFGSLKDHKHKTNGCGDITINNMCSVFAMSEIISHLAGGNKKDDVICAVHRAFGKRVVSMAKSLIQDLPPDKKRIAIIGGVAQNAAMVEAIGNELTIPVLVPEAPQLVNALGVALYLESKR